MPTEVASAFVSLVPEAGSFGRKMDSQIGPAVARSGKKSGATWGKIFAIGAGLAVGAKAVRFLGDSLAEAREAAKVGARTSNVIETMGLKSKVTAGQVADLANKISLNTGIDDEAIQSTENLLLGFSNLGVSAGKVGGHFAQATGLATDMSAAMEKSAKSGAVQLGRALQDPVKGLTALTRVGVSFTEQQSDQVKKLVANGKLFKAQGIIIGEVKKKFGGAAAAMANPAEKARVAFDNLKEQIGTALLPMVDRFLTFLTDTVIPGISDGARKIKRFFKGIVDPVKDFFDSATGHAAVATSFSLIGDAAGRIKSGLKGAAGFAKKIGDNLSSVDFGNLDSKKIGTALGEAVATGLNTLVTLAPKVAKKIGDLFAKVDWVGIGIEMGKQVPALLAGLAVGILAFDPLPLLKGLADHWQEVLLAVMTLVFAPAKIAGGLGRILARIPFVGKFLEVAVLWLNELGDKWLAMLGRFFGRVWTRVVAKLDFPGVGIVTKIIAGLKSLPGRLGRFFDDLGARLSLYAEAAFTKIEKGMANAIVGVINFVGKLPGRILNALGNLAKLLFPKGVAAIESLWNGLKSRVEEIFGWVKALPGRVVTAVGNVSNLLYDKGAALIAGFGRGILSQLQEVYDAAKKIAGKIAGLFPGSPVKEGPLRSFNNGGAGKQLMTMLAQGINAKGKDAVAAAENWTDILVARIKKRLEKAKDAFHKVRDAAKELSESVASAFTTDLFSSGSLAEFLTSGLNEVFSLGQAANAINALRNQGVNKDFLAALGQSGNGALAVELAADPAGLAQAQALFLQQQALSNQIGASVADAKFGDALDRLGGRVEHLEQQLLDVLPDRIGDAVTRGLNGMAAGAHHNAHRAAA